MEFERTCTAYAPEDVGLNLLYFDSIDKEIKLCECLYNGTRKPYEMTEKQKYDENFVHRF